MRASYNNFKELLSLNLNLEDMKRIFMTDTDLTESEMIRTITSYKIMFIHEQYDNLTKRNKQNQSEVNVSEQRGSKMTDKDQTQIVMNKTGLTETDANHIITLYRILISQDQNQSKRNDEDLQTIKTIFEEYYRSEMNIKDQEEIDKLFKQYIQTASIPNSLEGFISEFKDQNDNIRKDYVLEDIIFDLENDFDTDI